MLRLLHCGTGSAARPLLPLLRPLLPRWAVRAAPCCPPAALAPALQVRHKSTIKDLRKQLDELGVKHKHLRKKQHLLDLLNNNNTKERKRQAWIDEVCELHTVASLRKLLDGLGVPHRHEHRKARLAALFVDAQARETAAAAREKQWLKDPKNLNKDFGFLETKAPIESKSEKGPKVMRFRTSAMATHDKSDAVDMPPVTLADVVGNAAAKEALMDILAARRDMERYLRLGARAPAGTLLHGPPGTGKTLLARAFAGEAEMNFLTVSGSEFIEIYGGSGPRAVRQLFDKARAERPCVVFIDEIDSCGSKRSFAFDDDRHFSSMSEERDNTLNQLLAEIDGFVQDKEVLVLAATNRLGALDPALLRAGRFDRKVLVDLPDASARAEIFALYSQRILLEDTIDRQRLSTTVAYAMGGRNGADLELLANEAALLAARRRADAVSEAHVAEVVDNLMSDGSFARAKQLAASLESAVKSNSVERSRASGTEDNAPEPLPSKVA